VYGLGDEIQGLREDIRKLKKELGEKNTYILSLEYACSYILDWYWNIEEPGLVPNSRGLRSNLLYIKRVLKNRRGNSDNLKGGR
jgi:hypothetical protein